MTKGIHVGATVQSISGRIGEVIKITDYRMAHVDFAYETSGFDPDIRQVACDQLTIVRDDWKPT